MNAKTASQNDNSKTEDEEDYNMFWNYIHDNFYHENNLCTIA